MAPRPAPSGRGQAGRLSLTKQRERAVGCRQLLPCPWFNEANGHLGLQSRASLRCRNRSSPYSLFKGLLDVALGVARGDRLALVVLALATRQPQLDLRAPSVQV